MDLKQYQARLCWNSNGWRAPTGDAPKYEMAKFLRENGFGTEEWLFQDRWEVNGYRYGHITVGERARLPGGEIGLTLYTRMMPMRRKVIVAKMTCRFIDRKEAARVWTTYQKNGWSKRMVEAVREIGGKTERIQGPFFNVVYRPQDVQLFPLSERDPDEDEALLTKSHYYKLFGVSSGTTAHRNKRKGGRQAVATKRTNPYKRGASPETEVTRRHNEIQRDLSDHLRSAYPHLQVELEPDWVDIRVENSRNDALLVEVKAVDDPWRGLREGLGQVLGYACDDRRVSKDKLSVAIVTPGTPGERALHLLEWVRRRLDLPLYLGTWQDDRLVWYTAPPSILAEAE